MKLLVTAVVAITLVGCSSYQVNEKDIEYSRTVLRTNVALEEYASRYSKGDHHKAFAQSGVSSWGWAYDRVSKEAAIHDALELCRSDNQYYEESHPCEIVNFDGDWVK